MSRVPVKERWNELGWTLEMYAQQILESVRDGDDPPHPHRLDDWMTEYRTAYAARATDNEDKATTGERK